MAQSKLSDLRGDRLSGTVLPTPVLTDNERRERARRELREWGTPYLRGLAAIDVAEGFADVSSEIARLRDADKQPERQRREDERTRDLRDDFQPLDAEDAYLRPTEPLERRAAERRSEDRGTAERRAQEDAESFRAYWGSDAPLDACRWPTSDGEPCCTEPVGNVVSFPNGEAMPFCADHTARIIATDGGAQIED